MEIDELRAIYDTRYRAPFSGTSYKAAVERDILGIRHFLPENEPRRLCDVCCGRGTHLAHLAKYPLYSVVGVDLSSLAQSDFYARHGRNENVQFVCGTVKEFAAENVGRFDGVLCYLPHLDARFEHHTRSLVRSLFRLTTSHGVGIISFLCCEYAERLIGQTVAGYDENSCTKIVSDVDYCPERRLLSIAQTCPLWKGTIIEEMQLYDQESVADILRSSGFTDVTSMTSIDELAESAEMQKEEECKMTLFAHKL